MVNAISRKVFPSTLSLTEAFRVGCFLVDENLRGDDIAKRRKQGRKVSISEIARKMVDEEVCSRRTFGGSRPSILTLLTILRVVVANIIRIIVRS